MKYRYVAMAAVVSLCVPLLTVSTALAENVCYTYDGLARLKKADYSNGSTIDYTLDEHGNRKTMAESPSGAGSCSAPAVSGGTGVPDQANSPPDAVSDQYTVDEYQTYDLPVLANDTDPDGNNLIVTFVTSGQHGTASVSADKTKISYVAGASTCTGVTDQLTYTVGDQNGGSAQGAVDLTFNPTPMSTVTQPPNANDDSATFMVTATNAVVDVLGNDTDPDNDRLRISSATAPSPSGIFTITQSLTDIGIQPQRAGTASFTYTVYEERYNCQTQQWEQLSGTDTATVTVTIEPGDPCPLC